MNRRKHETFLTIFTPTYNRLSTLKRLYLSLCEQTDRSFEWLIVDDGSTDGTRQAVDDWMLEGRVAIRYSWQPNQGKTSAHNRGVEEARGRMFACIDSDDFLVPDAVEVIRTSWSAASACGTSPLVGLLAFKVDMLGQPITSLGDEQVVTSGLGDAYEFHELRGDTFLAFRSEVIKKFRFPAFEGEKFVPEAFLYDLIDQEGRLLLVRRAVLVVDYLNDGYSANMADLLYANPRGYLAFLEQRMRFRRGFRSRVLNSVRFVAMAISSGSLDSLWTYRYKPYALLAFIPGVLFGFMRYRRPIARKAFGA